MEKKCNRCQEIKDYSEFGFDKRYETPRSWCKICARFMRQQWREENPEKTRASNIKGQRKHRINNVYMLSDEDVQRLEAQEATQTACAICDDATAKLYIDHNHQSGRFRGLLCSNCNSGLGLFQDDIVRLARAITYLNKSP